MYHHLLIFVIIYLCDFNIIFGDHYQITSCVVDGSCTVEKYKTIIVVV